MITTNKREIYGNSISVDEVLRFIQSNNDNGDKVDQFVINIENDIEKSLVTRSCMTIYFRLILRFMSYFFLCFFHLINWLLRFVLRRKVVRIPAAIITAILTYILFFIILYFIYLGYWASSSQSFSVSELANKIISDTCPLRQALLNYSSAYITQEDLDKIQDKLNIHLF